MLLHNTGKEGCVQNLKNSAGFLLLLPYPIVYSIETLRNPTKNKTAKHSEIMEPP